MTFVAMSIPFIVVAAIVCAIAGIRAHASGTLRQFMTGLGATLAVLIALTVVFDNLMIAAGFFDYGDAHISGVRIVLMPIEDLLYPTVGALLLAGFVRLWPAQRSHG